MSAYASELLDNLYLHDQLDDAYDEQCFNAEELKACKAKYPVSFFTPNFAIRTGLFILTTIITFFSLGFISLFVFLGDLKSYEALALIYGAITYGALEFMVHTWKHFHSGVDDALIWITFFLMIAVTSPLAFNWHFSNLQTAVFVFVVAGFLGWRFVHAPMSAIACIAFFCIVFFAYIRLGALARVTAPFVILITTTILYLFLLRKGQRWPHYRNCINLMKIVTLLMLYASCNYFVVREMGNYLLHLDLPADQPMSFGWIFWTLSVAIPLVYIYAGIIQRDTLILRTGLLLIIALIFTIRNYYRLLSIEVEMIAGGLILIGGAYSLIRYLQQPKRGFTCLPPPGGAENKLQLESLIIAQTFNKVQPAGNQTTFGGGSGGGGGAGSEY